MTVASYLSWGAAHDGREPEHGWNIDVFWDWYKQIYGVGYQGAAWCGAAVCVSLTWGGGWKPPSSWISVWEIENWGRAHGRYHSGLDGCQPGDVLILLGHGRHTGVARSFPNSLGVKTYEGNTNPSSWGSQDNGDGYYSKFRSRWQVVGYVRVHDLLDGHLAPKPVPNSGGGSFKLSALPIDVDGDFGPQTIGWVQKICGAGIDGVFGFGTKAKLQHHLGVKPDGQIGPATIKALQKRVGVKADGVWGSATTHALQTRINKRAF